MRAVSLLIGLGFGLVAVAVLIGGRAAGIGGLVALAAQVWAVALLRPAMGAPTGKFMQRWLGGIAIRVIALALLIVWSATHRLTLPPLATSLGFLGVLLPLLFMETRFLK